MKVSWKLRYAAGAGIVLVGLGTTELLAQIDFTAMRAEKKVTAVRVEEERIVIDGLLDEPEWEQAEPARDFVQGEPAVGQPATEPTEVRLLYDRDYLYIGVLCWDSEGPRGIVVNDMRKDFYSRDGDVFQVILDPFLDRRNGIVFATNPKGARADMQVGGDGSSFNRDWDAIWFVKAKITDSGWQAELAIPFKSLRFPNLANHTWGINFSRRVRRKNEESFWSPIPRPYRVYRVSMAGVLEGLGNLRQGRNLYVKPYLSAPLVRREEDDVDFVPDAGLDVKYGVSSQLTLDLTVNTDFSQVEADEQQMNFTRFSLFFPEKREFFLENAEIFEFGRSGFRGTSDLGGRRNRRILGISEERDLIPFFSRRIGISQGQLVPILGGARLTGRAGHYRLGLLSMQADEFGTTPAANFTVARLRRDIFQNSDVGAIVINKQTEDGDFNRTFGVDANFIFFGNLDISSYLLKSETPELDGDDLAGSFRVAWIDRLLDLEVSHLSIQDQFNAEVGFVPRTGVRKSSGQFAFTPRPEERIPWIRELRPSWSINYITDQDNTLETREEEQRFTVLFQDSSFLSVFRRATFDRLSQPAVILGQTIPAGDYQFQEVSAVFATDPSRRFNGFFRWGTGSFYHGDRDSYLMGFGFQPSPQLGTEISWSHNRLDFPGPTFQTDLVNARINYSFTTNLFLNGLIQYNSERREIASNIRFNFIHRPLSDLFLVYNERRSSTGEVLDRALITKLTYLFDF